MKIVTEPSCARHLIGCTTSLPAKTGTTRRQLHEPRRKLREDRSEIREPRKRSERVEGNFGAVRRTLRALGATPRTSEADSGNLGGNPEGLGGSAGAGRWGTGQPGLQQGVLDRWRTD